MFSFLKEKDYIIEKNKKIPDTNFQADFFASKLGSKVFFIRSIDYLFFHFVSDPLREEIEKIHQSEREYVNGLYKTPRVWRLKVPNIVSIFISPKPFTEKQIAFAKKPTLWDDKRGGEKHSVILLDTSEKVMHWQGKEKVRVYGTGMTFTFSTIDPTNRIAGLVIDFTKKVWK